MCGIFLVLNRHDRPVDEERFSAAAERQTSRGPDYTFEYRELGLSLSYKILSFSRPKKADISDDEFLSEDAVALIALNGEIYNWKALSKEWFGSRDRFRSDTELLVNLIRLLGPREAAQNLVGMYAFVVYDAKAKALSYFRDPSGEKFLYKYKDKDCIILSSDIASILKYMPNLTLDDEILRSYICTRHFLTLEKTCYHGIQLVEKGSSYHFDIGLFSETKIGQLRLNDLVDERVYREHERMTDDELRSRLQEVLGIASADFLRDENQATCVVSGGVDSTLASTYLRGLGPRDQVIGIGISFPGKDETLQKFLDARPDWRDWVSALDVDAEAFRHGLSESYKIVQTPLPTHNFPSQLLLAKVVKKMGRSILISGDGADEAFGGYTAYLSMDVEAEDHDHCPSPYSGVVKSGLSTLVKSEIGDITILSKGWKKALKTYHFLDGKERVFAAAMLSDLVHQVESVGLLNADLMNLANSVEGRSFYMHRELLRFALNLPTRMRINPRNPGEDGLKVILKHEFARKTGLKPFPKVGYAGFPNEAAEVILQNSNYEFTSDLLKFSIKSNYKYLSMAEKWKVNNLELFSRIL
jgi:asparagine synthase (glutamine-hydrolysing)